MLAAPPGSASRWKVDAHWIRCSCQPFAGSSGELNFDGDAAMVACVPAGQAIVPPSPEARTHDAKHGVSSKHPGWSVPGLRLTEQTMNPASAVLRAGSLTPSRFNCFVDIPALVACRAHHPSALHQTRAEGPNTHPMSQVSLHEVQAVRFTQSSA